MQFEPWTFALQAINFLVLAWLLHRLFYRPVLAAIAARKAAAEKAALDLEARASQAEALRADLEKQRADLESSREATLHAARDAAEAERKALLAQAAEEAAKVRAQASKAFEHEREEAVAALGRDAARLATSITRRLLEDQPPKSLQAARIEAVCADVAALSAEQRGRIAERLNALDRKPRIVTAAALDPGQQAALAARLADLLGPTPAPEFQVDDTLIAGVEIHFPYTILRRSLASDLARIEAEILNDRHAPTKP
ncbi:MAG TPA: F0F1 ATP synthase subunit delta [Caulobacteraceae bacterium]|nr:F0F1 ATP synthase subunit delta [Caulobacteraceae bacterium]